MQSDEMGLVAELRSQAALKRDCNVCDGDGIKDGGRPCLGCGQTGSVPVHWGRVGEMMSEAAAAIERLVAELARLHNGEDAILPHTKRHAEHLYIVATAAMKSYGVDVETALARAEAERDEAREALKPFAALYTESMRDYPDGTAKHERPDDRQAWGFNNANLMWGDFRRARQALGDPK